MAQEPWTRRFPGGKLITVADSREISASNITNWSAPTTAHQPTTAACIIVTDVLGAVDEPSVRERHARTSGSARLPDWIVT